ncbi:MAG: bifunctional phosphopantothenoylcysteine decarboxylase/phosphopantothenate--cysteine ligase CoaBC [Gammaproteobacteria bacterium]|nr:bifunctional phosphopantothenoylcysteine decarboxylase/phosphopantothenate--cysteine ligase CoaBC [Gammaproteobacteria bacterium]
MSQLAQKQILLGVSGGIAAYKSADLVRRLQDQGAVVRVIMSRAATEFVTPMTFEALSGHPVHVELFETGTGAMEHIELARWADAILIAPASANTLARLAHGLADDLLSTVVLASRAPLAVAPAMNQQMWAHPAVQTNIETLRQRGVQIFGPASGSQACGDVGTGRMLEPLQLVEALESCFTPPCLAGKRVTITAGPTREALDPVRFISNRSSGKMGYALAQAARAAGAEVTLVSGPVNLPAPAGVTTLRVTSADDMAQAVLQTLPGCDIFIAAAAVADYRPAQQAEQKIKKNDSEMRLELVRNRDILTEVSTHPHRPFCVGFAAETENLQANAQAKLQRKQLDMIAANWVGASAETEQTGFDSDDNALHVYSKNSDTLLRKTSKQRLAQQLLQLIAEKYHEANPAKNS